MFTTTTHRRVLTALALVFALEWIAFGWAPHDRSVWMLENGLVVVLAAVLATTYRAFPLSLVSYSFIFLFLSLHTLGAHFTYARVPYDAWFNAWTGVSIDAQFGWTRNHFDRLVHFCYGLLFAYPVREVFLRVASVRGFWGYFLPLDLTLSSSAAFELVEWAVAETFGGTAGMDYLGTQGDPWDAHKDMALAGLGALLAMLLNAGANVYLRGDFFREWRESLRVKYRYPLGERALRRMLKPRSRKRPNAGRREW